VKALSREGWAVVWSLVVGGGDLRGGVREKGTERVGVGGLELGWLGEGLGGHVGDDR